MKFPFATVNASKFRRLPSRKNACNFSDRGKTRGRQRTESIARVSKGVGGNVSPFLFASDDLRFDLSPLERCHGLRTSRFAFIPRLNRIIVKFGSSRMEHRSNDRAECLAFEWKIVHLRHSPERFSSDVITNCKDFSIFRIRSMEFKAFQDRFDRDVHEMSIRIQRVSNYLYKPSCTWKGYVWKEKIDRSGTNDEDRPWRMDRIGGPFPCHYVNFIRAFVRGLARRTVSPY